MRRGELCGLKWSNVDIPNATIRVRQTIVELKGGSQVDTPKTNSSVRDVYVGKEVIDVLLEIKKDITPDDYVFCNRDGGFLIPSNINKAFYSITEKAGIKCRFHDLRHTSITHLISSGVDVKTISSRVGHSSVSMTLDRYTHILQKNQENVVEQMRGILGV